MTSKKTAPKNTSIKKLLAGILDGSFYTGSISNLYDKHGYIASKVDIASAPFDASKRYIVQTVLVPKGKRGNLAKYAGQKVRIICTTVDRNGPRIHFYIKKV